MAQGSWSVEQAVGRETYCVGLVVWDRGTWSGGPAGHLDRGKRSEDQASHLDQVTWTEVLGTLSGERPGTGQGALCHWGKGEEEVRRSQGHQGILGEGPGGSNCLLYTSDAADEMD